MRVLMTTDAAGGVWTFALELIEALARRGIEVVLAVEGEHLEDDRRRELEAAPLERTTVLGNRLEWMPGGGEDARAAGERLLAFAEETQPDLVHLNSYSHALLEWPVPVVVTAHSCVVTWWRAVRGGDPPAEWDGYRAIVTGALDRADVVVAPTHAFLDDLTAAYGFSGDRVVIPNGIDNAPGRAATNERLIIAAGRLWDEAKNVAAVAAVAPVLSWPVIAAGDAGNDARDDRVVWLGPLGRADLRAWFRRASIFCEPACYEPFGLAALEAAQAGCALVLGDIPSLREVWGDAAAYVDPDDDRGLERALENLMTNRSELRRRGDAARARASQFRAETMAEHYLALYTRLVRAAPALHGHRRP